MYWIRGKNCLLIDAGLVMRQSERQDGLELIEEKDMSRIGVGSQRVVRFGTASSQDDRPSPGFEKLAMPLFDSLYNFARWLAHNANDAEDLVQETYLKALRSFASFQQGTNFRAWIFKIMRNTFLSSCSAHDRRMTVAMDSEEDFPISSATSATPESLLIQRSGIEACREAIEQLPLIFREVILLCDVEDASYQEVAEILSIPMETVMSRLSRARKAVRDSLRRTSAGPTSIYLSSRRRLQEADRYPHDDRAYQNNR
jgi:RNA polymerase sigma-70 factor (ECF subfamily)